MEKEVLNENLPTVNLKEEQDGDVDLVMVRNLVEKGKRPSAKMLKHYPDKVRKYLRHWLKLKVINGVLFRRCMGYNQVIIPDSLKGMCYKLLHQDMGHLGVDRVYDLARKRMYWINMKEDITHFVTKMCHCVQKKTPALKEKVPIQNIKTTRPFELIGIDFLHLDKCSGGYEYVLVIVDNFSRFAQAYATRNKSAKTAARHLFNDFITRFGCPERIMHDQGGEFENNLFKELRSAYGIAKSRTTLYHPQCNGQTERMNRTIIEMLKTLTDSQKSNWKEALPKLVHAYNCTRNDATSYSPYFLMFGREPRLPIDMIMQNQLETSQKSRNKYIENWRKQLKAATKIANEKSSQSRQKHAKRINTKIPFYVKLKKDDLVLVRNLTPRGGTGKLRAFWEDQPSKIIEQMDDAGVIYKLKANDGKERILHRNLLLPLEGNLVSNAWPIAEKKKEKKKKDKIKERMKSVEKKKDESESSDDGDDEIGIRPYKLKECEELAQIENNFVEKDRELVVYDGVESMMDDGDDGELLVNDEEIDDRELVVYDGIESMTDDGGDGEFLVNDEEIDGGELLVNDGENINDDGENLVAYDGDNMSKDDGELVVSNQGGERWLDSERTKNVDEEVIVQDYIEEEISEDEKSMHDDQQLGDQRRSKRSVRPPKLLTYDQPGVPSYYQK